MVRCYFGFCSVAIQIRRMIKNKEGLQLGWRPCFGQWTLVKISSVLTEEPTLCFQAEAMRSRVRTGECVGCGVAVLIVLASVIADWISWSSFFWAESQRAWSDRYFGQSMKTSTCDVSSYDVFAFVRVWVYCYTLPTFPPRACDDLPHQFKKACSNCQRVFGLVMLAARP